MLLRNSRPLQLSTAQWFLNLEQLIGGRCIVGIQMTLPLLLLLSEVIPHRPRDWSFGTRDPRVPEWGEILMNSLLKAPAAAAAGGLTKHKRVKI